MILVYFFVLLAGAANGLGDRIKYHDPWPNNPFWSASSWRNVYKNGDPSKGERFLFSSSFLAFLCDGWHLLKFIWVESLCVAVALAGGGLWFYIVSRVAFGTGFLLFYK